MRAQDLIKSILATIDGVAQPEPQMTIQVSAGDKPGEESPLTHAPGDDINRFRQIVDLVDEPEEQGAFANEPDEKYADVDAVTVDAGGGMNGPKHPHDLRVKDPSVYPDQQDAEQDPEQDSKSSLHTALLQAMRGL